MTDINITDASITDTDITSASIHDTNMTDINITDATEALKLRHQNTADLNRARALFGFLPVGEDLLDTSGLDGSFLAWIKVERKLSDARARITIKKMTSANIPLLTEDDLPTHLQTNWRHAQPQRDLVDYLDPSISGPAAINSRLSGATVGFTWQPAKSRKRTSSPRPDVEPLRKRARFSSPSDIETLVKLFLSRKRAWSAIWLHMSPDQRAALLPIEPPSGLDDKTATKLETLHKVKPKHPFIAIAGDFDSDEKSFIRGDAVFKSAMAPFEALFDKVARSFQHVLPPETDGLDSFADGIRAYVSGAENFGTTHMVAACALRCLTDGEDGMSSNDLQGRIFLESLANTRRKLLEQPQKHTPARPNRDQEDHSSLPAEHPIDLEKPDNTSLDKAPRTSSPLFQDPSSLSAEHQTASEGTGDAATPIHTPNIRRPESLTVWRPEVNKEFEWPSDVVRLPTRHPMYNIVMVSEHDRRFVAYPHEDNSFRTSKNSEPWSKVGGWDSDGYIFMYTGQVLQ